jgi:hypothetical protein
MSTELTRVIDYTDEELSAADDPETVIMERIRAVAGELDDLITEAMQERGLDLRITLEVRPR